MWAVDLLELEFFWQVSDFLSRKIVSDLKEHLCWIQNTKTLRWVKYHYNHLKIRDIWVKSEIFVIFMFLHEACGFAGADICFDKSQIFCQGKVSWISQSTLCWIQNTKTLKSIKYHYNHLKMRDIWVKCEIFRLFIFLCESCAYLLGDAIKDKLTVYCWISCETLKCEKYIDCFTIQVWTFAICVF